MREILFRGKSKGKPEWVYGSLYKEGSQAFILVGGRFYPEPSNGQSALGIMDWYEVFPDSIGQFTGLTDKNGTEVYEGDLYTACGSNVYEIRFVNGSFCGGLLGGDDSMFAPLGWASPDDDEDLYIDDEFFKIMGVVGNIHDQKEDV